MDKKKKGKKTPQIHQLQFKQIWIKQLSINEYANESIICVHDTFALQNNLLGEVKSKLICNGDPNHADRRHALRSNMIKTPYGYISQMT